jgi:PTS system mannitol-specific IIC component
MSKVIMANIGIFMAIGIMNVLFSKTGWFPDPRMQLVVMLISRYLLPAMIGYTSGKFIGGDNGGLAGALASIGVVAGSGVASVLLLGPLVSGVMTGYLIKGFNKYKEGRIKPGFEMLANNFALGVVAILVTFINIILSKPVPNFFNYLLIEKFMKTAMSGPLPLMSAVIEPAKIFFLNNIINHGLLSPIGIQQSIHTGKSIFFLMETNPGPGFGVLLAIFLMENKKSVLSNMVIQFLGGIHEVYFPYVLKRLFLVIPLIAGGMTGTYIFSLLGSGLSSPASPGSVLTLLALAPRGNAFSILIGILFSSLVSFLLASVLLKIADKKNQSIVVKENGKIEELTLPQTVSRIAVVCDAGLGSSVMGANILKRLVKTSGLPIEVVHSSIRNLDPEFDMVITHEKLVTRVEELGYGIPCLVLDDFVDTELYQNLVDRLSNSPIPNQKEPLKAPEFLERAGIQTGLDSVSYQDAIKDIGKKLLELGYIKEEYTDAMLEREAMFSTYIGNHVAIPHGTIEQQVHVINPGIVIFQYPQGVEFQNGGVANLVIGIASKPDTHMNIVSYIADIIEDEELIDHLYTTDNSDEIYDMFTFT